jgi:uncharacterized protein
MQDPTAHGQRLDAVVQHPAALEVMLFDITTSTPKVTARGSVSHTRRASELLESSTVRLMEQRVSLITLGVADLGRSRSFYEHLGWRGQELEETVFFQAGGQALVLWSRDKLAADAGIHDDGTSTFGGIVLAHNVNSPTEVDEVVTAAATAGGEVTKAPTQTFYGGYAGYFTDPDGHAWEVAHNPGFMLGVDGTLTLPDFGSAT